MGNNIKNIRKTIGVKFPKLAMLYRYMWDNLKLWKEPKETKMGFKFTGNKSMQEGRFEPEETKVVIKLLQQVNIFINVGANIGYYCCHALKYGKYTVAFEPIELNLRCLYKNIKANHWERMIEIFPIALSDKIGIINIFGSGTGASLIKGWASAPEKYFRLGPSSTMDNVLGCRFQDQWCLILVDIEGSEKYMLEGAVRMLSRRLKPIWIVEICILTNQPKGIVINPNLLSTFEIFWNNNYEAWTVDKFPCFVSFEEIKAIIRSGINTLHTENFIFIEKGRKEELLNDQ